MSLTNYNLRSPGVKRLMREACELAEPTEEYCARPLEDNLFEWHFTVRGPPNTEFDGGFYHGRILLPSQYPMQPPNIILLTPNGRFEINKKICLSISGHHPESWQPSWSIRTALLALIAFMPTPAAGTIGSLEYPAEERKKLAVKSKNWECHICGKISETLSNQTTPSLTKEESSLLEQIKLKVEEEKKATVEEENNDNNSCLRQRMTNVEDSTEAIEEDFIIQDTQNTVEIQNREKSWNVVIGIILSAIILLVARRLFFL